MIEEGHYSVLYPNGDYQTYQIRVATKGALEGKTIISLGKMGIAFLTNYDRAAFWKRTRLRDDFPKLEADLKVITDDPQKAQRVYAMQEGKCCRCGRKLTVPASLYHGMGPECAGRKNWKKSDQIEAHEDIEF